MEVAAYKSDYTEKFAEKEKIIKELHAEKALLERQHEERVYRLQAELDESRENAIQMKKNEAVIEVYKKKMD